jgi:hypothetical protein
VSIYLYYYEVSRGTDTRRHSMPIFKFYGTSVQFTIGAELHNESGVVP